MNAGNRKGGAVLDYDAIEIALFRAHEAHGEAHQCTRACPEAQALSMRWRAFCRWRDAQETREGA